MVGQDVRIVRAIVTDGRGEYLEKCLASMREFPVRPLRETVVIDDSGDPEYGDWLRSLDIGRVWSHHHRRGLGASVESAWNAALDHNPDFVFHVEEDFVFTKPPPLREMAEVLDARRYLASLTLQRQPWNETEAAAGSQIAATPGCEQITSVLGAWVEHRHIFSFNPCLIPRRTIDKVIGLGVEAEMSAALLADPVTRFAYWGRMDDPPRVLHIGEMRSAGWTL